MTREALLALLRDADPLAAARLLPPAPDVVTYTREPVPDEWLVDGDDERPVEEHRAAHREGRPSEATVTYGAGVSPRPLSDRLLALGALARETALLARGVPGSGGRWGRAAGVVGCRGPHGDRRRAPGLSRYHLGTSRLAAPGRGRVPGGDGVRRQRLAGSGR